MLLPVAIVSRTWGACNLIGDRCAVIIAAGFALLPLNLSSQRH